MTRMVNRRESLRTIGRWIVLGAATAGIGALVARRGEACDRSGLCRGCPALSDCELPPAANLKRENGSK